MAFRRVDWFIFELNTLSCDRHHARAQKPWLYLRVQPEFEFSHVTHYFATMKVFNEKEREKKNGLSWLRIYKES